MLALDFETLDLIYSDSFIFSHSTGDVETKSEWLTTLRKGDPFTSRRVDQIEVELHDDVAVTQGRIHAISDSNDPRWREYSIWYIRVYAREEGRWQLLSHRSTREETGPIDPN